MSSEQLVTFRGGFVARLDVVLRLLAIEARDGRFIPLAGGGFKVDPPSALTDDDRTFIAAHRDEARRVLAYQADDSHLYDDARLARSGHAPAAERERTV